MKMSAERKVQDYRSFTVAGLILGLWFLFAAILPIWHPKVHIDKCPIDSAGNVIPDRTADGLLATTASIYFAHRDGVDDSVIGNCAGKSPSCNNLIYQLSGHVGEPIHVEYCGRTVSRVILSGNHIVRSQPPVSEAIIDERASSDRRLCILFGSALLFWGMLSFIKLRRVKREAI
jgi:hypothetical protein